MARKKVQLAWIENDKARALCLMRRRKGLLKKVKELSVLCDIWACLIIFSPDETEPVVWPSIETARGLLDDFFALPMFEQTKRETSIESYLEEKIKTVQQLNQSHKKNKAYVTNELMMQLKLGRKIDDLNLSEVYDLLSFSRDRTILWRENLDFMQFSPLRDPPVLLFEVQVEQLMFTTKDAFVGSGQDNDKTGKTYEATKIINLDTLRESKSHYLIDQWVFDPKPDEATRINNMDTLRENRSHYLIDKWVFDPKPLEPVIYQQLGNKNPNPNSYCPYQGSSSNENPFLEMEPVHPQIFHGLVGSASQPSQHRNMNNNPIIAMNQLEQHPFDFMSREMDIQEEGNNIHKSQFYRSNNTITTNDDVRQESPPNETTAGEDNVNLTSFDIKWDWQEFNKHHF